jgi:hypothetical protein
VTSSVPEIAFVPDHPPDAEQDDARVEDQVITIFELTSTEEEPEVTVTVAEGTTGATGAAPPPPPPPHEARIKRTKITLK